MPYAEQMHCVERNRAQRIEQALLLIWHAKNRVGGYLVHLSKSVPKPGHFCAYYNSSMAVDVSSLPPVAL